MLYIIVVLLLLRGWRGNLFLNIIDSKFKLLING